MGKCKKDVALVRQQWSYVFLAPIYRHMYYYYYFSAILLQQVYHKGPEYNRNQPDIASISLILSVCGPLVPVDQVTIFYFQTYLYNILAQDSEKYCRQ